MTWLPEEPGPRSRRAFLARLAGGLTASMAAPALLSGCRRDSEGSTADAGRPKAKKPAAHDDADETLATPAPPTDEPLVRIRILARRERTPIRIGAEGEWIELHARGEDEGDEPGGAAGEPGAPTGRPPVVLHGPVDVRVGGRGWSVLDRLGFRPSLRGMESFDLRVADASEHPEITVGDRPYPGWVRVVARPDRSATAYDVVNHVRLERYLPGVLEKELFGHWRPETFAAQAVAARSFACAEHSYRAHSHYDLTNTARSQVYGGVGHARAIEAAGATRGVVLAYGGRLVPGYYSSCCGGIAADAVDAISDHAFNTIPPLRGRAGRDVCTEASLYSWSIERSASSVAKRLAAWGRRNKRDALGRMTSVGAIEVAERNKHGRPRSYRVVTDADETVVLTAETMRRALDYSGGGLGAPKKRLFSSNVAVTFDGRTARFDGHGFGHGAGLCQHGAEALAQAGETHEKILDWYYPDVELVRAF